MLTLYNILSPPLFQGASTKEDGYLAYYEICVNIIDKGWDIGNPYPGVMGPYAYKVGIESTHSHDNITSKSVQVTSSRQSSFQS